MRLVRPVTKCPRLSLVETWAVRRAGPQALGRALGVGGRGEKVAAHCEEDPDVARSCMAWIGADGVLAVSARRLEAELGAEAVEERVLASSPRCPSCGLPARCCGRAPDRRRRPARPMLPRSRRKLTISWMLATAFLCWVRPIAQQTIMRADVARRLVPPRSRISRVRPLLRDDLVPARRGEVAANASKPSVCSRMKSWSKHGSGLVRLLLEHRLHEPLKARRRH